MTQLTKQSEFYFALAEQSNSHNIIITRLHFSKVEYLLDVCFPKEIQTNQFWQFFSDHFEILLLLLLLLNCGFFWYIKKIYNIKEKNLKMELNKFNSESLTPSTQVYYTMIKCFNNSIIDLENEKKSLEFSKQQGNSLHEFFKEIIEKNRIDASQVLCSDRSVEEKNINRMNLSDLYFEKQTLMENMNQKSVHLLNFQDNIFHPDFTTIKQMRDPNISMTDLKDKNKTQEIVSELDQSKESLKKEIINDQVITNSFEFCSQGRFQNMYTDKEVIGKGTFGEVFKARKFGDLISLKRVYFNINSEQQNLPFFPEVEALKQCNHDNIVKFHTYWIEQFEIEELRKNKQMIKSADAGNSIKKSSYGSLEFQQSMDYIDELVQFEAADDNDSLLSDQVKSSIRKQAASNHLSSFGTQNQSLLERINYTPGKKQFFILYIEMEFCEGGNLKNFIDTSKKDDKLIHSIMKQIASGIEYLHANNFLHRDLKQFIQNIFIKRPSNIFLDKNLNVRIGDLGLAVQNGYESSEGIHKSNVGTPQYMAPEISTGEGYSFPIDIFAMGIIYFELLRSFKTEQQKHEQFIKLQQLNREIKQLHEGIFNSKFRKQYPQSCELIQRMVSKNPKERPSASEISRLFK